MLVVKAINAVKACILGCIYRRIAQFLVRIDCSVYFGQKNPAVGSNGYCHDDSTFILNIIYRHCKTITSRLAAFKVKPYSHTALLSVI